jgi:hypothetical protein
VNIYTPDNPIEQTEKTCRDCQETKPVDKFKKLPNGNPMGVCASCQSVKANKTRGLINQGIDPKDASEMTADDVFEISPKLISKELWKNYLRSKTTQEKIRCLEALVKLIPADQKTPMEDAAVIQSLMASMRKKRNPENG